MHQDYSLEEGHTVGEHAGRGELDVGQGPKMVEHRTAVALFLRKIHKRADVVLLTVVPDPRANHHSDVSCEEINIKNMLHLFHEADLQVNKYNQSYEMCQAGCI